MKKSDKERLKKIVSTWENLSRQMQQHGITPELLLEDEFAQWAVTTPLYNIGEQVYQLSSEFKAAYPDQPWNMVAGLRHRLVHDYDGINWTIIVEVVFSDLDLLWMLYGRSWPGCEKLPRQKTFFCRFKKQGSAPVLVYFSFCEAGSTFRLFFETFSAFPLL